MSEAPQKGGVASLFWAGEERTQEGEHNYQAIWITVPHCGACGIAIPAAMGKVRCAKGHLNDLTKVGSHIRDDVN